MRDVLFSVREVLLAFCLGTHSNSSTAGYVFQQYTKLVPALDFINKKLAWVRLCWSVDDEYSSAVAWK